MARVQTRRRRGPHANPANQGACRGASRDTRWVDQPSNRALSLLGVDDHPGFLTGIRRSFERDGWQVATAIDGRSAIAQAQRHNFDVWLVDLRLPDMSGIEVVRTLRNEGLATPAVILTAFPEAKSAVEATKLGLEYVLKDEAYGRALVEIVRRTAEQRPVDRDVVTRLVQQLFETSAALASPAFAGTEKPLYLASLVEVVCTPTISVAAFLTAAEAIRIVSATSMKPASAARCLRRLAERLRERNHVGRGATLDAARRFNPTYPEAAAPVGRSEATDVDGSVCDGLGWTLRFVRLAGVMRRAVLDLAFSREQIAQIGYRLGYQHHSVFCRDFRDVFGVSPRTFRALRRS